MSLTDALSRIQEIQTDIKQVSDPAPVAPTATATTTTANTLPTASATQFLSALTAAQPTAPTADASSSAGLVQNGTTGADVLTDARKYLGVPYVFGGETRAGMDCSGLVQTVFKDLGITMPRTVGPQSQMGQEVPSLAEAQPGDLIVQKGNGHIQIYAGNGMILEAPKPGSNVVERKEWLSADQIGTIRRIVPATQTATTPVTPNPTVEATTLQQLFAQQLGQSAQSTGLTSLLGGAE
ncbi:C40 family peptidase [Curtobacterium sp. MCSS17_016]|uniref:C40 family peptidase n=1 Tax=Curtobacterium sp. MCSS17_016 TaxID=2175644 RepID=UPI000DAAA0F9|nr:C40 family peptidase [Curtobacterium sp. MCSS17_016]WIE80909.1 C40 family peptidase [Curtobacterium sp. MCSS17_016]